MKKFIVSLLLVVGVWLVSNATFDINSIIAGKDKGANTKISASSFTLKSNFNFRGNNIISNTYLYGNSIQLNNDYHVISGNTSISLPAKTRIVINVNQPNGGIVFRLGK